MRRFCCFFCLPNVCLIVFVSQTVYVISTSVPLPIKFAFPASITNAKNHFQTHLSRSTVSRRSWIHGPISEAHFLYCVHHMSCMLLQQYNIFLNVWCKSLWKFYVCVVNTGVWQPRTLLFNSFLFIEPAVTVKFWLWWASFQKYMPFKLAGLSTSCTYSMQR